MAENSKKTNNMELLERACGGGKLDAEDVALALLGLCNMSMDLNPMFQIVMLKEFGANEEGCLQCNTYDMAAVFIKLVGKAKADGVPVMGSNTTLPEVDDESFEELFQRLMNNNDGTGGEPN